MKINKNNKCIIIFSGFNQRAVIAFLRTLEKNNLDYAIIAKSNDDDIFLTNYKEKVMSVRKVVTLQLIDLIESIKSVQKVKKATEYLIVPSTEALNRFLLDHRQIFESLNCTIPLVHKELYELISNKYHFSEVCLKNNILIPNEIRLADSIIFPIVAKPKTYFSSIEGKTLSPVIIKNIEERNRFLNEFNLEDFYFQEFISGESYYLLYYFHRNGKVYKFSQKNLMQQPDGKSMLAAISSNYHKSEESNKYERLFKKINFFGLVMIEIKVNSHGNYMIEANPRFWGPSQLFVDADVNFFDVMLHDYGYITTIDSFKEPLIKFKYFWYGGLVKTLKQNKSVVFQCKDSVKLLYSLPEWIENDIYRRGDTKLIFDKEIR